MRVLLTVLAMVLQPGWGLAGPWPRAEGAVFLSFAAERDPKGNSYTSLYGEYGWSARRTLGIELGHTNVGETSALVWLQQSLAGDEGANRYAISSGMGVIERNGEFLPLGIVGASWGRGIERLPGGGWVAVDARVKVTGKAQTVAYRQGMSIIEYGYLTPEMTSKLDVTLGFKPWEATMFISQLRMEDRKDEGLSTKLATSLVYDIKGAAKIEAGAIAPLRGAEEGAIRIGTWFEF